MFNKLEKVFIVLALLFFANAFMNLNHDEAAPPEDAPQNATQALLHKQEATSGADPTASDPIRLGLEALIYLITASLIVLDHRKFLHVASRCKLLWVLTGFAFVSVLWSHLPFYCFRRCIVLLASTCFGVYLAARYSSREILKLLAWAMIIAAVCSVYFALALPQYGIDSGVREGAWQGIFFTKNSFGRMMSLAVVVFTMFAVDAHSYKRWLSAIAALMCTLLVVLSRDLTAILTGVALLALLPLLPLLKKHSFGTLAMLSAVCTAITAAFTFLLLIDVNKLLALVGKDATLSGRMLLWSVVWDRFLASPWVGYGYSSFWVGLQSQQSADVWSIVHWAPPHSHNGFLDLLVQVGIIGMLLFVIGFIGFFRNAVASIRLGTNMVSLWPMMLLAFTVVSNLSESSILKQESIFWVLFVTFWTLTQGQHSRVTASNNLAKRALLNGTAGTRVRTGLSPAAGT